MMKVDRPKLDQGVLRSIIDPEEAVRAEEAISGSRALALQAWRDALLRRDELRRRIAGRERAERPAVDSLPAQPTPSAANPMPVDAPVDVPPSFAPLPERKDSGAPPDAVTLAKARAVAAVGSRVPEFPYHNRALRVLARLCARIVLFFAGFITVHQRVVNAALVDVASGSAAEIARLRACVAQLADNLNRLADSTMQQLHDSADNLNRLADSTMQQLHDSNVRLQRRLDEGEARMLEQDLRLADIDCEGAWLRLAEAEHRDELDALRGEPNSRGRAAPVSGGRAADADRLYVDLENEFRGPRELIKARLTAYLPILSTNGLGTADRPILDLGCGRGEWLELLSERGLLCRGVDVSELSTARCRELGFDAVTGDALSYLREQPAEYWGMVSAFHVVEHLPFEYLVAALDEILRVLKAGGVILLETPNPENLVVSANYFHCDPTHLRPLHPYLMAQVAKQRGFIGIDLLRQTESRPDERLAELDPGDALAARLNPIVRLVNRHLASAPDYALIGQKPW